MWTCIFLSIDHMIYIVSATVRGEEGVYIMFFHSCKDRDFVFVQGNLAKSWGCVDFSFYYFSLGSHLINTMKGFNYCKREKLFLKTQVGIDKSSMLNYIPLSGKKSFIGAICVDSLVQGFPREQNHLDVCHNLM